MENLLQRVHGHHHLTIKWWSSLSSNDHHHCHQIIIIIVINCSSSLSLYCILNAKFYTQSRGLFCRKFMHFWVQNFLDKKCVSVKKLQIWGISVISSNQDCHHNITHHPSTRFHHHHMWSDHSDHHSLTHTYMWLS